MGRSKGRGNKVRQYIQSMPRTGKMGWINFWSEYWLAWYRAVMFPVHWTLGLEDYAVDWEGYNCPGQDHEIIEPETPCSLCQHKARVIWLNGLGERNGYRCDCCLRAIWSDMVKELRQSIKDLPKECR